MEKEPSVTALPKNFKYLALCAHFDSPSREYKVGAKLSYYPSFIEATHKISYKGYNFYLNADLTHMTDPGAIAEASSGLLLRHANDKVKYTVDTAIVKIKTIMDNDNLLNILRKSAPHAAFRKSCFYGGITPILIS
jgi:hypothetical protein